MKNTNYAQGNCIYTFVNIIWGEILDPDWGNLEWILFNSSRGQCGMWLPWGLTATERCTAPELQTLKTVGRLSLKLPVIKIVLEWGKEEQQIISVGNAHWMLKYLNAEQGLGLMSFIWHVSPTGGSRSRTKVTVDAKLRVEIYSPFQAVETWEKVYGFGIKAPNLQCLVSHMLTVPK